MDTKTKLLIIGIPGALMMWAMWWMANWRTAPAEWSDDAFLKPVAECDGYWKQTMQALDAHEYWEAGSLHTSAESQGNAVSEMMHLMCDQDDGRAKAVERWNHTMPGKTLDQWENEHQQAYRKAVDREADWAIEQLKIGGIPFDLAEWFFSNTPKFREALPAIHAARTEQAPHWFRVVFDDPIDDREYNNAIERALREKWNDTGGYKLVIGRAMEPDEDLATWKTLKIQVDEKARQYDVVVVPKIKRLTDAQIGTTYIPQHLSVSFQISGAEATPTAWDHLPKLEANAEAPDTLKYDKEAGINEYKTKPKDNRNALVKSIKSQLQNLPAFQVEAPPPAPSTAIPENAMPTGDK